MSSSAGCATSQRLRQVGVLIDYQYGKKIKNKKDKELKIILNFCKHFGLVVFGKSNFNEVIFFHVRCRVFN